MISSDLQGEPEQQLQSLIWSYVLDYSYICTHETIIGETGIVIVPPCRQWRSPNFTSIIVSLFLSLHIRRFYDINSKTWFNATCWGKWFHMVSLCWRLRTIWMPNGWTATLFRQDTSPWRLKMLTEFLTLASIKAMFMVKDTTRRNRSGSALQHDVLFLLWSIPLPGKSIKLELWWEFLPAIWSSFHIIPVVPQTQASRTPQQVFTVLMPWDVTPRRSPNSHVPRPVHVGMAGCSWWMGTWSTWNYLHVCFGDLCNIVAFQIPEWLGRFVDNGVSRKLEFDVAARVSCMPWYHDMSLLPCLESTLKLVSCRCTLRRLRTLDYERLRYVARCST